MSPILHYISMKVVEKSPQHQFEGNMTMSAAMTLWERVAHEVSDHHVHNHPQTLGKQLYTTCILSFCHISGSNREGKTKSWWHYSSNNLLDSKLGHDELTLERLPLSLASPYAQNEGNLSTTKSILSLTTLFSSHPQNAVACRHKFLHCIWMSHVKEKKDFATPPPPKHHKWQRQWWKKNGDWIYLDVW